MIFLGGVKLLKIRLQTCDTVLERLNLRFKLCVRLLGCLRLGAISCLSTDGSCFAGCCVLLFKEPVKLLEGTKGIEVVAFVLLDRLQLCVLRLPRFQFLDDHGLSFDCICCFE